MDFEEIKERYKLLPLWARFLIAGIIGLLPGAYVYYDEGDSLQTQRDDADVKEGEARAKFEHARKQKANLPKLEEEMAFTEEQLLKAKQKLPDSYKIEDVLQKAAMVAKEVGVKLVVFDPAEIEIQHPEAYNYVELPIKTEIQGRFGQVASFFDRMVHLENSVFVRRVEMARAPIDRRFESGFPNQSGSPADQQKSEFQIARENRQNLRIKANFELVVFRGMTKAEEDAIPVVGENGEEKPKEGEEKPAADGEAPAPPPVKAGASARAAPANPHDVTTF